MTNIYKAFCLAVFVFSFIGIASAEEARSLTDEQWEEDINQFSEAIKEDHFKAFTEITEAEFDLALTDLLGEVPEKSDLELVLGLAEITARIKDGHTRIHLSRQFPEFALVAEAGHSGNPAPNYESLKFKQLPVSLDIFEDGIFVIGASTSHRHLIGNKVIKFGETDVEMAIEKVAAVSFFENESRALLIAADRLMLPEVLAYLGIIENADQISVTIEDKEGNQIEETLTAFSGPAESWVWSPKNSPPEKIKAPIPRQNYQVLPEMDAILVSVAEFEANPDQPYSDFVHETLEAARKAGVSRYIIDLRQNSGGAGSWTTSFLRALSNSEFNEYGRLFILIGRVTFSASQKFLNQFEEQTYAMFVGEPGGAKPSHYGDAKKIILENSGLTLRVSTIYWQSWMAGDFRKAVNPHLDARPNAAAYFSGQDPALEAILSYTAPATLGAQIAEQFKKGKIQNGAILFQRWLTDASIQDHFKEIPSLLKAGHDLLDEEFNRPGFFMFFLVNNFFPGNPEALNGLGRAYENMGKKEAALEAYNEILEIDPNNKQAQTALERISSQ